MKLHIFNPEHDLSMAFGKESFTPPHAARELRSNMGYLPALWAEKGDVVLVNDVEYAIKASQRFKNHVADVLFLSWEDLKKAPASMTCSFSAIEPWGWDDALRTRLRKSDIAEDLLPTPENMAAIRQLSNRRTSMTLLQDIHAAMPSREIIGESCYCTSHDDIDHVLKTWKTIVLKAPWSSSGRGVRYVTAETLTPSVEGWIARTLEQQQGVLAEPYYNKVKDFGMEFMAHEDGSIEYLGLSLFHTLNSTYVGNLLASENEKQEIMQKYAPQSLLHQIVNVLTSAMSEKVRGVYSGPFGIDMMVVAKDEQGFYIHPCVELNLRRTMGHVALSLTPPHGSPQQLMRIIHDVNYQLRLTSVENNFVNVI